MVVKQNCCCHHMLLRRVHSLPLIFALVTFAGSVAAKDKHPKATPQDRIQVIAHIPATGGRVVRFLTTDHYRRNYLYAEQESGKTLTLIDITNVSRPAVLAELADPAGSADNLVAVAGNAALVAVDKSQQPDDRPSPQTFRILSFADPLHPAVQQEFKGVTAIARDDRRGLIFLADSDGVWILEQQLAPDPEAEKEWEHMMLDAR